MMARFRSKRPVVSTCLGLTVGLTFTFTLMTAGPARAQHTPDPYNIVGDYNRQYEPFLFNTEENSSGIFASQRRTNSGTRVRGQNRFESLLEDEGGPDGPDPEFSARAGRAGGAGNSFYNSYRQYDQAFGRVYRPNDKIDKEFYQGQQQRERKYFEARDATKGGDKKRGQELLREFNTENSRAARNLSNPRGGRDRETERDRDRFSEPTSSLLDPDDLPTPGRRGAGLDSALPESRRSTDVPPPPTRSRTGVRSEADSATPLGRSRLREPGRSLPSQFDGRGRSATTPRTGRSPTDVLNRSRALSPSSSSSRLLEPRSGSPTPDSP